MTEEIPKRDRYADDREERTRAYCTLFNAADIALEIQYQERWHYVVAGDETLFYAESGDTTFEELPVEHFELLLTGERVLVIDDEELTEFDKVL